MTRYLLVATATETRDQALALAEALVSRRLAASGQILAATTVYWHLSQMGTDEEWRIEFPTTADRYPELERALIELHPWDNPQITATVIEHSTPAYRDWVDRFTSDSSSS